MSFLTTLQTFFTRRGLPKPAGIVGSSDATVLQVWGMADEVVEDIVRRCALQSMLLEASFTTLAQEDQGSLYTIAPTGFYAIKDDTIFNRTQNLEFVGPVSASEWQRMKAANSFGVKNLYRIRGDRLLMNPIPVAGNSCAFEYYSKFGVVSSAGIRKESFTADNDDTVFDPVILQAGLAWKWKAEKGFDYAEEFRRYEELANGAGALDGTKRDITMDGTSTMYPGMPVIVVPGGSILR